MLVAVLALRATPAAAQTALEVAGTLTIAGGGRGPYSEKYTGVTVSAGTEDRVIQLPPEHDTLVIRGDKLYGDACGQGADCWNTDICADNVCGWSGIEVAQECGSPDNLQALDRTLDDCIRLWAVENPTNVAVRADACMKAGESLWGAKAVVSAVCPQRDQYRAAYDFVFSGGTKSVLNKAVRQGIRVPLEASIGDPAQEWARVGQMQDVLRVIDSWFRGEVARRGTAADPVLFGQTSAVTALFFKSAYVDETVGGQLSPVSVAEASRIAEKIQRSGFAADKQVLRAAYGPEMPIQTAPLLLVTADALQGLSDRTSSFATVQDIACRFRSCSPGRTSIGNYMKLLASLARDGATVRAAVDLASTNPRTGEPDTRATEWTPIFGLIADQHAALERATLSARDLTSDYDPATLETTSLSTIPAYAAPLASVVRPAITMSSAFESTGTFRPRPRQLAIGMDSARNERIRAEVDRLCRSTDGVIPLAVRAYQDNEKEYITNALSVAQSQIAADKAAVQLSALAARYRELSKDMAGLRATRQAEEITFGSFMHNFEALARGISETGQHIVVSPGANDIDVQASDSRYDSASGSLIDILAVAVRKPGGSIWKLERAAGDMVNFSFAGKWAPTCALRKLDPPDRTSVDIKDQGGGDVLTGPEGYSVARTANHTYATSNSLAAGVEAWASARLTHEACGGVGVDVVAKTSVKTCASFEIGARVYGRDEYSKTSGSSSINSFTWGEGVRSPETPFPSEPVGSLLLVELPRGKTSTRDVRNVQVLTYPQSSIIVGGDSDFYLVVNDSTCTPVSDAKLSVRVAEITAPGTLSRALAQAMAASQEELRGSAGGYVAQGRLLAGQPEMLRAQALNKVYALSKQSSLSIYAESLRNLFEAFVSREIANIDREIQLVLIERQMRALVAEEDGIRLDLATAETSGRVASLLGALSLRNLDLVQLQSQTSQVAELVRDWMGPVVDLRLAGDLVFSGEDKQTLDRVISLSPVGKYVDNLRVACPAVNMLMEKLKNDDLANPAPVVRSVIISVPNPSYSGTKPSYREVDQFTAARIWDSILKGGDVDITITPSLFYENKEPFSLQCQLNSPVVLSMGYYLVRDPLGVGGSFNSETTTVFPDMLFPRQDELFRYTFMNGRYLTPQVTILVGNDPARTVIDEFIGNSGPRTGTYWKSEEAMTLPNRGTSPFAHYHLDLSRLRSTYSLPDGTLAADYPFVNAAALLVAFQVEAISQAPNGVLPGVPACE